MRRIWWRVSSQRTRPSFTQSNRWVLTTSGMVMCLVGVKRLKMERVKSLIQKAESYSSSNTTGTLTSITLKWRTHLSKPTQCWIISFRLIRHTLEARPHSHTTEEVCLSTMNQCGLAIVGRFMIGYSSNRIDALSWSRINSSERIENPPCMLEVLVLSTQHFMETLRIMEDGRMMLGAVHQDYIHTTSDYPDADIGYPNNPDLGTVQCLLDITMILKLKLVFQYPVRIFPIKFQTHLTHQHNKRFHDGYPQPTSGTSMETPTGDNFSMFPTWSKLVAGTHARSLILMFSNTANENGKAAVD